MLKWDYVPYFCVPQSDEKLDKIEEKLRVLQTVCVVLTTRGGYSEKRGSWRGVQGIEGLRDCHLHTGTCLGCGMSVVINNPIPRVYKCFHLVVDVGVLLSIWLPVILGTSTIWRRKLQQCPSLDVINCCNSLTKQSYYGQLSFWHKYVQPCMHQSFLYCIPPVDAVHVYLW